MDRNSVKCIPFQDLKKLPTIKRCLKKFKIYELWMDYLKIHVRRVLNILLYVWKPNYNINWVDFAKKKTNTVTIATLPKKIFILRSEWKNVVWKQYCTTEFQRKCRMVTSRKKVIINECLCFIIKITLNHFLKNKKCKSKIKLEGFQACL